jgi:RNA polymerase sigma-70 factor (ECF subfamily)
VGQQEFIVMESQRTTVVLQEFLADPKNREASGNFARKYQPRIKGLCLARRLQDADAEDLTASILLSFCVRDVFDGFVFLSKAQFQGWLNTVAAHAVLTFLRNRGRRPEAWSVGNLAAQEFLQRAADGMVPELVLICAEDRERVDRAGDRVRATVDPRTWEAFRLAVCEGRPVPEVADRLAMTRASVWTACSRIKRKLRQELKDLLEPPPDER